MKQRSVFVAGSMFTEAERIYLVEIARAIESKRIRVYLPFRDAGDESIFKLRISNREKRRRIYRTNLRHLLSADLIIAIIDGSDIDSGTAFEIGLAQAKNKIIYGLRTDIRQNTYRTGPYNLMIEMAIDRCFDKKGRLIEAVINFFREGR